jgi:hypothetical protein
MKTRTIWLVALALLPGFGLTSLSAAPARADHGGQNGPTETRVRIILTGAAIRGITTQGHADFRTAGTQRQLNVEVEKVNLADGTVLAVKVNGAPVGMLALKMGRAEVELNTNDGAAVPVIHKGDTVTIVAANGAIVESGTF